jgi:hypothetical protein
MPVNAQRGRGIRVAELVHHRSRINAESDQENSRKCAAAYAARGRKLPRLAKPLVRSLDGWREHSVADIARVLPLGLTGAEHEFVRPGPASGSLEREQLVAQDGEHVDLPNAGICLGRPHSDPAATQIDVALSRVEQLTDPQPGEHQRRERSPPHVPAIEPRRAIELASRIQQHCDVLCAIQLDPRRR